MKKSITLIFVLLFISTSIFAQNTVGLISYDINKAYDGFNLMFPHNQPNVYLLDNCGEIVHVWEDADNFRPGNIAYISNDGYLYKGKRDASVGGDRIWAGGGGAILEIRDWDNNLMWDFEMNDSLFRLHHDFAITETGNIIALAWELKNADECIAVGRDTSTLAQSELWPDWVFEIDPFNDTIVWEWHAWDHLVQDFDETKPNWAPAAEHPELIDVNYGRPDGHPDWHHGNALDYNDELNQIMISIPYFDEVWVIDHTTTTEEAAGHTGGFGNKGGDLLFRWGNPFAYARGDSTDQRLFFQHDAQWVDDFLDPGHPYYGKMAVFNNRVGENYSTVNVFTPAFDMYKWRYELDNNVFLPETYDLTIFHPDTTSLFSTGLSSTQFLPNGNVLITSGRWGYTFELTPDNQIVWEYKTPLVGGSPATQGDTLNINNNLTFRMKRYPANFSGFEGKDLSPKGWLELEPDSTYCDRLVPVVEIMDEEAFRIYPNPSSDKLTVEWDGMFKANIEIFDIMGKRVAIYGDCSGSRKYIDTSLWLEGIYFVSIKTENSRYSRKILIQR